MSVKFKCVASGNIFEFTNEHDIKTMRTHPGYVELQEVKESEEVPIFRKPGRPKKETTELVEE